MRKPFISLFGVVAFVGGLGTSAAAQVVTLECAAEVQITDLLGSNGVKVEPRGTWEFVVDTTPGRESVWLKSSSIYRIAGTPTGSFTSLQAQNVRTDGDLLTFCLQAEGCVRNIPNDFGGFYMVETSVIDRTTGRFGIAVENFLYDLKLHQRYHYFGACAPKAPPPQRQF